MSKVRPAARRKARRFALQALYQWQLSKIPLTDIEAQFLADEKLSKADIEYFCDLLRGVLTDVPKLDEHMREFLDRPVENLDPVELAILRIGIYELAERLDVPYRVVINEALELTKLFGAEDGHKYVNGVLDQVARRLRKVEMGV